MQGGLRPRASVAATLSPSEGEGQLKSRPDPQIGSTVVSTSTWWHSRHEWSPRDEENNGLVPVDLR